MSGSVQVLEKGAFAKARSDLSVIYSESQQHCAQGTQEAHRVVLETQQELIESQSLLQRAIAEEQMRLADVSRAEAWVATASVYEMPAALAELARATREYEIAVARRERLTRRVELASRCTAIASEMRSTLGIRYNTSSQELSQVVREGSDRMRAADDKLTDYLDTQTDAVQSATAISEQSGSTRAHKTHIPQTNGHWTGEPGNSEWVPDSDTVAVGGRGSNPEGKTWGELKEQYGIESIPFKDGEPDFSKVSKGEVKIDSYSSSREDNFYEADIELAKQRGCDPEDVQQWREEHRYTWHERQDMKTLQKVPTEIHGNVPHRGGISQNKLEEGAK